MIRRFYAPSLDGSRVELDAEQSRHAQRTLRLGAGALVEMFDGRGTVARGRIERGGGGMACVITERWTVAPPGPSLMLAAAMPKGARAEALVEGATQAGVNAIVPLLTERSVVEPGSGKRDRFARVAIEASKQAGRAHVPTIAEPRTLPDLLAEEAGPGVLKLIADAVDDGEATGMDEGVWGLQMMQRPHTGLVDGATLRQASAVVVLVGPEGGWTDGERRAAAAAGFARWRFNRFILRVETAGLIAAGLIRAAGVEAMDARRKRDRNRTD